MSDLAQAALISGGIFAAVMLRGYGRRAFNRAAIIFPVAMVAGFGYAYLRHMPLGTVGDWTSYAVAIVLGLVFGGAATLATRLVRDREGTTFTVTGPVFMAVWAAAVVIRLVFVWAITDWGWAREHIGLWMIDHHISFDAIAPFFLLWALTMVVSRLVVLKVREAALVEAGDGRHETPVVRVEV